MVFIRVKDESTGHEFDVPESDPRVGQSLKPVSKTHYPPTSATRRPKHSVGPTRAKTTTPKTSPSAAEKEA